MAESASAWISSSPMDLCPLDNCPSTSTRNEVSKHTSSLTQRDSPCITIPQAVARVPMAQSNGTDPKPVPPIELAFALPTSPDTNVHLQIMSLSHALTVYLASSTTGAPASMAALGSLVYALPSVRPRPPSLRSPSHPQLHGQQGTNARCSATRAINLSAPPSIPAPHPLTSRHVWRRYWRGSCRSRFMWVGK